MFCQDVTKFGGAGRKKRCCKEKMAGDEVRYCMFRSRFVESILSILYHCQPSQKTRTASFGGKILGGPLVLHPKQAEEDWISIQSN